MSADIVGIHGAEPAEGAPEAEEKIIPYGGITRLDLPVDRVLSKAMERGMDGVIVIGYDGDGEEYFASTYASGGTVLWLLERCKARLMNEDHVRSVIEGGDNPA